MKTHCALLLAIAATVITNGCGKQEPPAPAPTSQSGGYLGTLVKGQQSAIKTIDATSLNENIKLFNVQEGRNPTDLNELVTKNYLGALPQPPAGMKFAYDATQGKVSVVPQ
jgi:hypothetical protein